MTQAYPNLNPADQVSPEGVLNHLLKQFSLQLAVRLPAIVQSYDRAANMVTVLPAPALETSTSERVARAALTMTVLTPAGGGFFLNFPLKAGDTGHIVAFDRDISLFVQNLKAASANTNRSHVWEDSVFIPDKFRDFNISGEDMEAVVLQSLDGATKISVKDGEINIMATAVKVNATQCEINASVQCTVNTPLMQVNGQLNVTGALTGGGGATMTGGITNTGGDIVSDGISLESHVHGGVEPGGSDTEGPK